MKTDMNWTTVLDYHAERAPDQRLAVFNGQTTTYGQMRERARAFAAGLAEMGVERGDVVAILAFNSTEFLEFIFAANCLGAVAMPINYRLAAPEVTYLLENSGAKALMCEQELLDLASRAGVGEDGVPGILLEDVDVPAGWRPLAEVRRPGAPTPDVEVDADDLHRLMYTSGTTSRPKGVMITHGNLIWKNIAHVVEFGMTVEDIGLVCGPLYHVGALDLTSTSIIYAGGSLVIHRKFDAEAVVSEIERSGVTNIWLAPSMINAIVNLEGIDEWDLSSVRFIIDGGEKMPEPLIKRLGDIFPSAWFADAYGLTETVSGDTFLDKRHTLEKLGSVGKPCLHLEVDIWDEEGNSLPLNAEGEIVLRGPKVCKGYWRNQEATEEALRGGWFHTGDLGYLDEDGFLYIVDRLKDMIVSGGENIASSEVERVLYEHQDVLEAAVVARSDERWGEVPVAFVVLREGSQTTGDDLIEGCLQELAKFKVPKVVHFVDELPRNPSGKILKRTLRERVEEEGS